MSVPSVLKHNRSTFLIVILSAAEAFVYRINHVSYATPYIMGDCGVWLLCSCMCCRHILLTIL